AGTDLRQKQPGSGPPASGNSTLQPHVTATAPDIETQGNAMGGNKTKIKSLLSKMKNGPVKFDVFSPSTIFDIISGKTANLFRVDTPRFSLHMSADISFSIP